MRCPCMVWCGVVWCGVVWCGVVWCGVVWCGVVWCGVVWCGVVWCGVVWCGVVWCGVVWQVCRQTRQPLSHPSPSAPIRGTGRARVRTTLRVGMVVTSRLGLRIVLGCKVNKNFLRVPLVPMEHRAPSAAMVPLATDCWPETPWGGGGEPLESPPPPPPQPCKCDDFHAGRAADKLAGK